MATRGKGASRVSMDAHTGEATMGPMGLLGDFSLSGLLTPVFVGLGRFVGDAAAASFLDAKNLINASLPAARRRSPNALASSARTCSI